MALNKPQMAALGMLCFSVLLQTILTFAANLGSQWVNCNMQAQVIEEFSFGLSSIGLKIKAVDPVFGTVIGGTVVDKLFPYEKLTQVNKLKSLTKVDVGEIGILITATSAVYWLCLIGLLFGFVAAGLGAAGVGLGRDNFFVAAGGVLLFDFLLTFIGWAVFNFGVAGELKKLKVSDIVQAVMKIGGFEMDYLKGFVFEKLTGCTDQSSLAGSTLTLLTFVLLLLASSSVLGLSCVMCFGPKPNEMAGPMMQGRQAGAMQMQQMPPNGGPYSTGGWPPSGGPGGPPPGGPPRGGPPMPPMQMHYGNAPGRSPTGY